VTRLAALIAFALALLAGVLIACHHSLQPRPAAIFVPSTYSAPEQPRLPGEFEPVEELLLAWDDRLSDFLVDVAAAAWGETDISFVLGRDQEQEPIEQALRRRGLDPSRANFIEASAESIWIRDYGPLVVRRSGGRKSVIDFTYFGGLGDDRVPQELAASLWPDAELLKVGLQMEGGNLLSDGSGRCILALPIVDPDPDDPAIATLRATLREATGCRDLILLPSLVGESTGHVDMYAHLAGPGRALVGRYRPENDPVNTELLDHAARTLEEHGFRVTRVPMPSHRDGNFRTYVNALPVNHAVLVPVYPGYAADQEQALAAFRAAYPDRRVVPIDASRVIGLEGAIHCAALTVIR
jgi:agmatine deiminase